jgi:hypothetical protein
MAPRATTEFFIKQSIPDMLSHIRLHYSYEERKVVRDCADPLVRVRDGHIHRDVLAKANDLLLDAKKNIKHYKGNGLHIW